jgi:hypothetical protein
MNIYIHSHAHPTPSTQHPSEMMQTTFAAQLSLRLMILTVNGYCPAHSLIQNTRCSINTPTTTANAGYGISSTR